MSNSSLELILRHKQEAVGLRSDHQVAAFDRVGPGRILHQAYSVAGGYVEDGIGLVAHKCGMGPVATSRRIEKAFGRDSHTRQSKLDSMYDSFRNETCTQNDDLMRALKKDCQKLLQYALPSQSAATQAETFKQIIILTTRYPGLGRLFFQSPDVGNVADSSDTICELWRNIGIHYDEESCFTLKLAANCLSRIEPNLELEKIRPSKLGCACMKGLGVVDKLVTRYCGEGSDIPRQIAIRYIAAILELPAFWSEDYEIQKLTMDNLCKKTFRFIEDVDPVSVSADNSALALLDPCGIDALADAILAGGKQWLLRQPRITGLGSDFWLPNFVKLIKKLRGLILPSLLPTASRRAAEDWEGFLKDITDEWQWSGLDYQFEDLYAFVPGNLPDLLSEEEIHKVGAKSWISPIHNIILFGEAGAGKSSLVNLIVGSPVAKVSSCGEGCTFKNEAYEVIIGDTTFNIYDTAGLDEGDQGRVPHWEAIRGLYTLIRQLGGVSLLIYCMRGRVRENATFNWILFNKVICGEKVPIVAVVTGLETYDDPDHWWRAGYNRNAFKKNGMRPKDVACVVSFPGRQNELADIYSISQGKVRSLITKNYLREPWSEEKDKWFANIYKTVITTKLGFPFRNRLDYSAIMRNLIFNLIKVTKMEEEDAEKLRAALLNAEKNFRKRGD